MHKQTVEVVRYSVLVNNQEYIVTEADPSGFSPGSMGAANIIESKILINDTMTEQQKMATLVHEVTHIIACHNALSCEDSEQEVSVLANGVYDFIVNNPEVVLNMLSLYHDLGEFGMSEVGYDDDDDDNAPAVSGEMGFKIDCTCTK